MYKIVSLFSGAGGLDLGFKKAGFNNILSVEYWGVACSTLKENNMSKKIICDDIRNIAVSYTHLTLPTTPYV